MTSKTFRIAWLMIAIALPCAAAEELSPESYLAQVRRDGPDYRSAQKALDALVRQQAQPELIYSPMLTAKGMTGRDREQNLTAPLPGTGLRDEELSAGVSQKTRFGAEFSVQYQADRYKVSGAPGYPDPFYLVQPTAQVSLPLWRNQFGRENRATVSQQQLALQAAAKLARYRIAGIEFNARLTYWKLALARTNLVITEDILARHEQLVEWAKRRAEKNLADESETLQTQAALRVRQLENQQAAEQERTLRLAFNRMRGVTGQDVPETLEDMDRSLERTVCSIPDAPPERLDLAASRLTLEEQQIDWKTREESFKPDLSAFTQVTGSGLDNGWSASQEDAFDDAHTSYFVGLNFSMPLDRARIRRTVSGYKAQAESASFQLDDKRTEVNHDWTNLRLESKDARVRLQMAGEIEKLQRDKADSERVRLREGRTTQFQMQSFENEYEAARLNRLQLVLENLTLAAQADLYLARDADAPEKA